MNIKIEDLERDLMTASKTNTEAKNSPTGSKNLDSSLSHITNTELAQKNLAQLKQKSGSLQQSVKGGKKQPRNKN
jgi:hypothetical protein